MVLYNALFKIKYLYIYKIQLIRNNPFFVQQYRKHFFAFFCSTFFIQIESSQYKKKNNIKRKRKKFSPNDK